MKRVAVVAHTKKTVDGGLPELRRRLEDNEDLELMWFEVSQSAKAGKTRSQEAVKEGVDLVLVWGGDGSVQRCIDALAGTGVTLGIVPAGTANLFATNLGIPTRSKARSTSHSKAAGRRSTRVS